MTYFVTLLCNFYILTKLLSDYVFKYIKLFSNLHKGLEWTLKLYDSNEWYFLFF